MVKLFITKQSKQNNMKNIHILPTDKPSRIRIGDNGNFVIGLTQNSIRSRNDSFTNQHIYITSNEEIKVGDWVIEFQKNDNIGEVHFINGEYVIARDIQKKIILTTDQDLIKDGVQAIDDTFLEWFIKNPKSENVYVYKEYKQINQNNPATRGSTALVFSHYEVQSLDLSVPIKTNEKQI